MGMFRDVILKHSIEIRTTPEKIWDFFLHLDEHYTTWHPEDHVLLRWIKGKPWEEGSVVYAEEYLHGKLHRLKFQVVKVVPNREVEFSPASRILRFYFPKNTFLIEQRGDSCFFTATGHMKVGWIVANLFKKQYDRGIESARKHMKEEGENLKRILEKAETTA
jgi:hypothetical protein